MVGKTAWAYPGPGQNGYGTYRDLNGHSNDGVHRNHQSTTRLKPSAFRFKDSVNKALEDREREEIKNKLIEEIKREQFEGYRKDDEFIHRCKNKGLKKFYEDQNQALNDWLEVDMAVRSIADDIFESFDPDADHDGIPERRGALQNLGEDVEAFLPEEEREKRRKANRNARWAINVGGIY
jgi:hypothetical protein